MIGEEQLHKIRDELGIMFCSEHSLKMAALEKIVRIAERIICDKELPEAYAAGYINAGGDPNRALNQGLQYLEFMKDEGRIQWGTCNAHVPDSEGGDNV